MLRIRITNINASSPSFCDFPTSGSHKIRRVLATLTMKPFHTPRSTLYLNLSHLHRGSPHRVLFLSSGLALQPIYLHLIVPITSSIFRLDMRRYSSTSFHSVRSTTKLSRNPGHQIIIDCWVM